MRQRTVDELVAMYLNKAGRVNAQFTIHFDLASEATRHAVVAKINEKGLKPYQPPKRKTIITKALTKIGGLSLESIQAILLEVQKEREGIADRLKTLAIVEDYYRKKLAAFGEQDPYEEAHKYSTNNRTQLALSSQAGCFYCGETFKPEEIEKWLDGDKTAMCPRCNVDSVIGDQSGYKLTSEFLQGMYDRWFSKDKICSTDSEPGSAAGASPS